MEYSYVVKDPRIDNYFQQSKYRQPSRQYRPEARINSHGLKKIWDRLYEKPKIIEWDPEYFDSLSILGQTNTTDKIWISNRLDYRTKEFVLAHELVHCLRRQEKRSQTEKEVDREAEKFLNLRYNLVR